MPNPVAAENVIAKARTLLNLIDFDNNGVVIGNQRQGGNGGLMSLDTIKAVDQLRLALDHLDTQTVAAAS